MSFLTHVKQAVIAGGGGPVTKDRYTADNSSTWVRGQLLKLSGGTLTVVQATDPGLVDSATELTAATKLFIALDDLTAASAEKQPVQRILTGTRLRSPLLSNAAATTPPTAPESIIGTQYALWQDGDANFAPDKDSAATNPVVEVTAVEGESDPWYSPDLYKDSNGNRVNFVEYKFLTTVVSDL